MLERTSFLLRFGEHRDNSRNSQSVFLVVQVARHLYEAVSHPQEDASGRFCSYKIFMKKSGSKRVETNELVWVVKSGLFYYNKRRTIVYGKKMPKVCVWMCMLRMRIRLERKSIFRNEAVIIRES